MISSARAKMCRLVTRCAIALAAAIVLIAVTQFPYDVDTPLSAEELATSRKYWGEAFKEGAPDRRQIVQGVAEDAHIREQVSDFAAKYGLQNGAILDIGSGQGNLQDVVENYTGFDISSSVARFYHKKFVQGSATAMPFPDNSFDGGWSIWVLEHVPNPEQALTEIRRVMKNNAVLFLYPAWNCADWLAEGYTVRPYSDFDLKRKVVKASIPVRDSTLFKATARIPSRIVRNAASWFGRTRLHYRLLTPNYEHYWVLDSNALNGIDRYEMMLWFRTRGDECLNCEGLSGSVLMTRVPSLVIRVHK